VGALALAVAEHLTQVLVEAGVEVTEVTALLEQLEHQILAEVVEAVALALVVLVVQVILSWYSDKDKKWHILLK
jgi:intergrase/recombinase